MIRGEQVILRALEEEDLPQLNAWMNDPRVNWTLAIRYPISLPRTQERHAAVQSGERSKPFAITTLEGRLIGNCMLVDLRWEARSCGLAIMIGDREYWGQGYGTDAVRTLVRFAFRQMNLERVDLHVFGHNERGKRCYERVGFRQEGVLKGAFYKGGEYHDLIQMALRREDVDWW